MAGVHCDITAGEAALCKGYGKDAFVNGMLAAFWGTAARRGWRPRLTRVESKANVADAVSRGDLTRARRPSQSSRGPRLRGGPGGGRPRLRHQLSRHGLGGRGRRGCTECALLGASQFWGRNVGSRARSASSHPKDVPLMCPRFSACLLLHACTLRQKRDARDAVAHAGSQLCPPTHSWGALHPETPF